MKLLQNHTPKDGLQTHDVHSISKWGTPSYQANKRNTIEDHGRARFLRGCQSDQPTVSLQQIQH